MEACTIEYIPTRLHTNDKPHVPEFKVGEIVFRRCKHEHIEEPFDGISLYDLSNNREGERENPFSLKEDVLLNLVPDNGKGNVFDESIITLEIKEITENNTYEKNVSHDGVDGNNKPATYTCFIQLLHDQLPCNYSHCIFRLTFNGEVVTRDNYKNTLRRKGELVTQLRNKCKIEFERMIIEREVRINWEQNEKDI